jgi:hypothetical protein
MRELRELNQGESSCPDSTSTDSWAVATSRSRLSRDDSLDHLRCHPACRAHAPVVENARQRRVDPRHLARQKSRAAPNSIYIGGRVASGERHRPCEPKTAMEAHVSGRGGSWSMSLTTQQVAGSCRDRTEANGSGREGALGCSRVAPRTTRSSHGRTRSVGVHSDNRLRSSQWTTRRRRRPRHSPSIRLTT